MGHNGKEKLSPEHRSGSSKLKSELTSFWSYTVIFQVTFKEPANFGTGVAIWLEFTLTIRYIYPGEGTMPSQKNQSVNFGSLISKAPKYVPF